MEAAQVAAQEARTHIDPALKQFEEAQSAEEAGEVLAGVLGELAADDHDLDLAKIIDPQNPVHRAAQKILLEQGVLPPQ